MAISTRRDVHKKYTVSSVGSRFAKTDTLAEAKQAGKDIARKEAGRGRWNVMYLTLTITKQSFPGSAFYKLTGWEMYIPVRGTGRTYDSIVAEIKRRHGVAPLTWRKRR